SQWPRRLVDIRRVGAVGRVQLGRHREAAGAQHLFEPAGRGMAGRRLLVGPDDVLVVAQARGPREAAAGSGASGAETGSVARARENASAIVVRRGSAALRRAPLVSDAFSRATRSQEDEPQRLRSTGGRTVAILPPPRIRAAPSQACTQTQ